MKALTVRQPWAWAIIHAGKNIENRRVRTDYRGPLLIHAGKHFPRRWENDLCRRVVEAASPEISWTEAHESIDRYGSIIGRVNLVDCVHVKSPAAAQYLDSPWASGPWLWILGRPEPLEFVTEWGRLGIFSVSAETEREITRQLEGRA